MTPVVCWGRVLTLLITVWSRVALGILVLALAPDPIKARTQSKRASIAYRFPGYALPAEVRINAIRSAFDTQSFDSDEFNNPLQP